MRVSKIFFLLLLGIIIMVGCKSKDPLENKWSKERAWDWYNNYDWMVGSNFNPSTSINQLEFWQKDTFDPETIERELEWSSEIGMNLHRVYLHNLLWGDSEGFIKRLDKYLSIADRYNIKTMFVLLDDVWHPIPKIGKQPEPIAHVHNSGWVQSPGAEILGDSTRHIELESYIKGVLEHFENDDRIAVWDLYNEPDNVANQKGRSELEVKNKNIYSLALLKKVVRWAREVDPSQPLTVGLWKGEISDWGNLDSMRTLERFMIENSDIITFHAYDGNMNNVKQKISELQKFERPLICTEYLARSYGNTFEDVLPIFKNYNIGAINWGLVSGKSNTIYPWSSWTEEFTQEPEIWHHDIFRQDGTPYSKNEVDLIKRITNRKLR